MRILHVTGARPNFIKVAPVYRALAGKNTVEQITVHTGQHYDFKMSDGFLRELDIPPPDANLNVGSGTHAQQTAEIMLRFESVVNERYPDIVVVYGDVNSTVAAALVCSKLQIKVAHVEAGLRSLDRTMPEEINRLLTDQLSDLLFTPSVDADTNLAREGVSPEKIHLVGNVMIDTLVRMLPAAHSHLPQNLPPSYALVTLHRPSNVDDLAWLSQTIGGFEELGKTIPVIFPLHPRTRQRLDAAAIKLDRSENVRFTEPLPYMEFLALQSRASVVITDSGGIQEESTYLGIPCVTVRENTERPVTVRLGTNTLAGRNPQRLADAVRQSLNDKGRRGTVPPLWDGRAAERIAEILIAYCAGQTHSQTYGITADASFEKALSRPVASTAVTT